MMISDPGILAHLPYIPTNVGTVTILRLLLLSPGMREFTTLAVMFGGSVAFLGAPKLTTALISAGFCHRLVRRALNIHTFVKFDEFLMNLSPNLIRDRRTPYLTIVKFN